MFEDELLPLAVATRAAVIEHRQSGSLRSYRAVRVKRRDFTLQYNRDINFANAPPERIEEEAWDWRDQLRFQEDVIKRLSAYTAWLAASPDTAGTLEPFLRSLCYASYRGIDDAGLRERVATIAREINGAPSPVIITGYFVGLSITESPVVISDRLRFRYPEDTDMMEFAVIDEFGGDSFPRREVAFDVVCDFTTEAVSTGAAQKEFRRTIEPLYLFRVGGVGAVRYRMHVPGSSRPGGEITAGTPYGGGFTYVLTRSDVPAVAAFLGDIAPLLPDPFRADQGTDARTIAYSRYKDALFSAGPPERGVTSAITALEALFLMNEPELSHRLAQRLSTFLRVLHAFPDADATYENVRQGYGIRSTYIHGDPLKPRERERARVLLPTLMEYVRSSILAFFQMNVAKKTLLKELDRAMIMPAGVGDLEASLRTVAHH